MLSNTRPREILESVMTTFWLPCGPAVHQPEVKMESFPAVGATKSLKALFVARCANSFACGSVANVHSSS